LGCRVAELSIRSEKWIEHLVTVARAISHPIRLDIYRALGERGQSLSAVARAFGLSPAGAHHHLDALRRAQMIRRRYVGRQAIYFWSRNRWSLVCQSGPVEPSAAAEGPPDGSLANPSKAADSLS
jgi:hypothetical protein